MTKKKTIVGLLIGWLVVWIMISIVWFSLIVRVMRRPVFTSFAKRNKKIPGG